jgi:AcrR family transcriptional regulator
MAERLDKVKYKGRDRLIRAAQKLAQKSTFDEITVDEIVKAADLSRPAFYYHFAGGKEELRAELVREGCIGAMPAHDTRKVVLDAALRVFARAGVTAATLDDIAAEAGVSRSALCWHFHCKEDLLRAIIERQTSYAALRTAIEQVEREIQSGGPLDDGAILRRIAGGFYDSFTAQGDLTRLSILLIHTHPEAAHILAEKIVRGRKGITEYIKKRQEEGIFRKEIDAALFVQTLAMTFAMHAVGQGLNDLLPFAHLSREEIINQLVSLLLNGIKTGHAPAIEQSKL